MSINCRHNEGMRMFLWSVCGKFPEKLVIEKVSVRVVTFLVAQKLSVVLGLILAVVVLWKSEDLGC